MSENNPCFFCSSPASDSCDICSVSFCSDRHKKFHDSTSGGVDGKKCSPVSVASCHLRGRHLIAERDISAGEIVFEDNPFVVAPISKSPAVCLGCFKIIRGSGNEEEKSRCGKCELPYCRECLNQESVDDKHNNGIHENECDIFSRAFSKMSQENRQKIFRSTQNDEICPLYACVGPLRLLLAIEADKEVRREVDALLSHDERRQKDKKTWMLNHVLIAGFLRGACRLQDRFASEDIHRAIGILRTNGVKLDPNVGGRLEPHQRFFMGLGVYPIYSLLNHSCLPNVRGIKGSRRDNYTLRVVAVANIKKGEEILTRYTTPQWATTRRQQMLQNHWYFSCQCARCVDKTELGTMMNAVRCENCAGYLLPERPTELDSEWKCDACERVEQASIINDKILKAEMKAEKWNGDATEDSFELMMKDLAEEEFHPNHFVIIRMKEKIIQSLQLGQTGWEKQLRLFREICQPLIKVDPPGDVWEKALCKLQNEVNKNIK